MTLSWTSLCSFGYKVTNKYFYNKKKKIFNVDVRYLHLILSQKIYTFCSIELLPFGSKTLSRVQTPRQTGK